MERCTQVSGLTLSVGIDDVQVDRLVATSPGDEPGSFDVKVRWTVRGSALHLLGGIWRVSAWGPGVDRGVQLADESASVVATPASSISHAMTLHVPTRALPVAGPGRIRVEVAHQNQGQPSELRCETECDAAGAS
jgi:hypothetical protein